MEVHKNLQSFIPVAKLIANTFGKNCEVVLHDFSKPESSVVYTENNHVTGRRVGQSFDSLVKNVLLSKDFKEDLLVNYIKKSMKGKRIKSSTALIRDENDKVIGSLCVNYAMDEMLAIKEYIEDFTIAIEEDIDKEVEVFPNVYEVVDDLIDKIIKGHKIEKLKRTDKVDIVRFMDEKGIFLIKGAIDKVAEKLNVSKVTIYSYLDEIKKQEAI